MGFDVIRYDVWNPYQYIFHPWAVVCLYNELISMNFDGIRFQAENLMGASATRNAMFYSSNSGCTSSLNSKTNRAVKRDLFDSSGVRSGNEIQTWKSENNQVDVPSSPMNATRTSTEFLAAKGE